MDLWLLLGELIGLFLVFYEVVLSVDCQVLYLEKTDMIELYSLIFALNQHQSVGPKVEGKVVHVHTLPSDTRH